MKPYVSVKSLRQLILSAALVLCTGNSQARLTLLLNDTRVDSWRLDRDIDCWTTRTVPNVTLKKGDTVTIEGRADGDDWARVDFVEFIQTSELL